MNGLLIMATGMVASLFSIVSIYYVDKRLVVLGMLPYWAALALKLATDAICKTIKEEPRKGNHP